MSTEVENRVVEMEFKNDRFEKNVATTLSTIDKLKQGLSFAGVSKGFEEITHAAGRVNMSGVGKGIDDISSRLSALQVIGVTALANIANSAVNAGKRMISAFTIDPVKTGFSEYETQINAIQTVLANTESKGTTLNDVNRALDTLNTYADKTIYNFTEMTRNIGTFTAAGVDLDTSVQSIKGIANLAAVSGSTSQQASTAMYQLSQALASGTVKLMDWNSVVNAGMGGQVFQDALKETARIHGVAIDEMIANEGSFRETLKEEWLTADILTETLEKFTMATEGVSEAEIEANRQKLKTIGYTDAQIESIFKLGNTATNAATKVKTFTQLWDTLKESAQSGWTQTWEIIVGDFEESKELLTRVSDTVGGILNDSAKVRNDLLQGWKDAGGRADVIATLESAFSSMMLIAGAVKEAFADIFPQLTVDHLVAFTDGIRELVSKMAPSTETLDNIKNTFKGVFAVLDIGRLVLVSVFKAITPLFGGLGDLSGGILGVTGSIGEWLVKLNGFIKQSGFFEIAIEKVRSCIEAVIEGAKTFGSAVGGAFSSVSENAAERLEPLSVIGNVIKNIFVGIGSALKVIAPFVYSAAVGIGNVLTNLMDTLTSAIQNADYDSFFDATSGGIMTAIGVFIAKFFKEGSGIFDGANGFVENINGILEGVGDAIGAFTDSIKAETLKKIATAIGILAASLFVMSLIDSEKLAVSLVAVTTMFGELMAGMAIFAKIVDGKGILRLTMTSKALTTLATAILILSVALKIMSTMSWSEMGVGLISLTVGLGALVGAVQLLPETKVNGAAKAIQKMSTALLILAIAIKIMSTMSWSEMGVGLISMVAGLAALVGAVNLLPKDSALRATGMIALATAMVILGAALKIIGSLSWGELAVGLTGLAVSLAILVAALKFMDGGLTGALAILIIAPALVILANAMKTMGSMSWEEIAKGLIVLAASLLIIADAIYVMTYSLPGAAALIIVAAALAILAPVLTTLGSMSWGEIARGLVAIAGAFAIIGIAGFVLGPLVPIILSLAGAIALLGTGFALVGAGVLAFGIGLTAMSTAGAAAAVSITTIAASLIGLIPYLLEQVGVGIVRLCEVIAGSVDAIYGAVTTIIIAVVDAIVAAAPKLVDGVLVLITTLLESLVEYVPRIGSLLVELFVKLVNVLAENMGTIMESIFTLLVAIVESITSEITRLVEPILELVETVFQGIADIIAPVIETVIIPVLEELGNIFDSVFDGIATVVDSVGGSIKKVLDGIAGVIESIGTAALNAGTGFEKLANGVKIITKLKLADMVASLTAVANGIGDIAKHADGLVKVAEGMSDLSSESLTAAETMITEVIIIIKDSYSDFYDAGGYVVEGFASGIDDETWEAEAKARAMAKAALKAAEEALDVNSPSKEFYRVGTFGGMGFVNAFADYESSAFGAGSELGNAATRGLTSTMSRISDIIDSDIDVQPVIRPVLDLSAVRSGAGAISGMFGLTPSVGVLANTRAISAAMNTRGQNGFNSDVVSAIDKLGKSLGKVGNTYYTIEGITYDDGSNIANAIGAIARAAIRERRV